MNEYKEILELFKYCQKIGVIANLESFLDGYAIRFLNGDVVQHKYSYGSQCGFVEPAIGIGRLDYTAVSLKNAKRLVRRHKEWINRQ